MSNYRLHREFWRLQYEGLREICFECRRYGQRSKTCLTKDGGEPGAEGYNVGKQDRGGVSTSANKEVGDGARYGEWILVQRVRRRPMKTTTAKGNVKISQEALISENQGGDHGKSTGLKEIGREKISLK